MADDRPTGDPHRGDPGAAVLPHVPIDEPAAVLLVDRATRRVVYANSLAEQLAPGVVLPAGVDAWSDAAGLRDVGGEELSDTAHPLSRLSGGTPVQGQAVSARRASQATREREPLWVVGLPLAEAPGLGDHALVLLLPLLDAEAVAEARARAQLRERAVLATGISFTVADARADDMPLIFVNPAFTLTTGYTPEEVLGRNCRFLQGPETDPGAPAAIRAALAAGEEVTVTLLNRRRDGTAFWNQVSINPIRDADGDVTHFVGIQHDVTERVEAEPRPGRGPPGRADARRAPRAPGRGDEHAGGDARRRRLARAPGPARRAAAGRLGRDPPRRRGRRGAPGRGPPPRRAARTSCAATPTSSPSTPPSGRRSGASSRAPTRCSWRTSGASGMRAATDSDEVLGIVERLGWRSSMVVPLRGPRPCPGVDRLRLGPLGPGLRARRPPGRRRPRSPRGDHRRERAPLRGRARGAAPRRAGQRAPRARRPGHERARGHARRRRGAAPAGRARGPAAGGLVRRQPPRRERPPAGGRRAPATRPGRPTSSASRRSSPPACARAAACSRSCGPASP